MFTGGSSEKFRIAPDKAQIDTTHFRPHAPANDQRLYTRPPDRIGVTVAADAREDVEPPPGQFASRGRADAGRRTSYYGDLLDFS
jgi:hypothetical protein